MIEKILDYYLDKPQRMISLGYYLVQAGCFLVVAGIFGHVGTGAMNIMGSLGGATSQAKTLAEMYPNLPTWWIPESIFGALPALGLVVAGIWLNVTGKRVQRFMDY